MNDAKYDYEIDEDDINTAYNEAMDKKRFKILMNAAAYFRQGFELDENSPEAKSPDRYTRLKPEDLPRLLLPEITRS